MQPEKFQSETAISMYSQILFIFIGVIRVIKYVINNIILITTFQQH